MLINELENYIESKDVGYLRYHRPRYELLVELIEKNYYHGMKILDIGNSQFSEIVAKLFKCQVNELGFIEDKEREHGKIFQFDLNDSQDQSLWRKDIGSYDMIIFAEVIEHLYTSPSLVLNFLYSLLEKDGQLIIQTPNATVLHKRLQLLLGRNPYMLIRENKKDPGHFREYTKKELVAYATASGFEVEEAFYGNYFDYRYTDAPMNKGDKTEYLAIFNLIYNLCPPSLKPGITLILRKK